MKSVRVIRAQVGLSGDTMSYLESRSGKDTPCRMPAKFPKFRRICGCHRSVLQPSSVLKGVYILYS